MKLEPLQQILASLSKQEIKSVIKLISIEVLDKLGDDKYLITQGSKTFTATSTKTLNAHERYWALLQTENKTAILSNLIKYPHMLKTIEHMPNTLLLNELNTILKKQDPLNALKDILLHSASQATSKHQFTQITNFLLPLLHNIITIPVVNEGNFGVFQLKKRYNKKNKKLQIDFYAAFCRLGPVSGILSSLDGKIIINLYVAFLSTKLFLEQHLKDINYNIYIHIKKNIDALSDIAGSGILDLNT